MRTCGVSCQAFLSAVLDNLEKKCEMRYDTKDAGVVKWQTRMA